MIRWKGTYPQKLSESADADFDHIFSDFFQRRDLSFSAFKLSWKAQNGSGIHFCCPDKCDESLFLQLMFQFILTRLNCVPQIGSPQMASMIDYSNSSKCDQSTKCGDHCSSSSSSSSSSSIDNISSNQSSSSSTNRNNDNDNDNSSNSSNGISKSHSSNRNGYIGTIDKNITRSSPILEVKCPFAQQAIWNIAVIYSLYCMYSTQPNNAEQVSLNIPSEKIISSMLYYIGQCHNDFWFQIIFY